MTPRLGLRAAPERTLESLYQRHAADVYRYALMMLDSPADAEDVTQTTFLNAYRALLRGERPRSTGRWLRTIAHNLCLQHFRQASRRPRQVELEDEAPELVREDQGFVVEDLSRALRQIPVNQRAALLMRELEGRPISEIAGILDVSTSAVETLLFRARRGVREQLEGGLSCAEAEQAISRQLDGQLKRSERGALRAHLRECEQCEHLARSLRAQRGALMSLGAIPIPAALAWSKFGGGAGAVGVATANAGVAATGGGWLAGSLAAKLAGAAVVAALAGGASYVAAVDHPWTSASPVAKVPVRVAAAEGQESPSGAAGHPAAASTTLSAARVVKGGLARENTPPRSGAQHARGRTSASTRRAHPARSQPTAGASRRGPKVGRSRGRHSVPPKRSTRPKKPTGRAKPARPAKPAHPAKPIKTSTTPEPATPRKARGQAGSAVASLLSTSP